MAKANKQLSLDKALIEKLGKEANQSGLVNDLLNDYYNKLEAQSKDIIKEKIKNNKTQIRLLQKKNKELQINMKKIIKKTIQKQSSISAIDERTKMIKDKRATERARAREFELYVKNNKIKLTKLDFHELMFKFSEETKEPIIKFMKSHRGI